jgi:hypothetical protein
MMPMAHREARYSWQRSWLLWLHTGRTGFCLHIKPLFFFLNQCLLSTAGKHISLINIIFQKQRFLFGILRLNFVFPLFRVTFFMLVVLEYLLSMFKALGCTPFKEKSRWVTLKIKSLWTLKIIRRMLLKEL